MVVKKNIKMRIIGYNSRLDDIQAGFLSVKLKTLDNDNQRRRAIAKTIFKGLKNPKIRSYLFMMDSQQSCVLCFCDRGR